uniref:Uncharacterized protein n=1 Tax=Acrobeloides nanus TaxID=290746 RepID=A0A914CU46_9BILA
MASINLSGRRNTWDKSVRRPTIEEAVKNFWNELYILSHVSLTASKAVYILLKMLALKSGCAVKIQRLVIQFYSEEFNFLLAEHQFLEKLVNPLHIVFIERFDSSDDKPHNQVMVNYLRNPKFLRISSLEELIFRYEMGPLDVSLDEILKFVCDEEAFCNRDYINLGQLQEDMYMPFVKRYIENFQQAEYPDRFFQRVRLLGNGDDSIFERFKFIRQSLERKNLFKEMHGLNEFVYEVVRKNDSIRLLIEINEASYGKIMLIIIK